MDVVICELCGDNAAWTVIKQDILWCSEAWVYSIYSADDACGNVNDVADYAVLFRTSVFDFGGGEFVDFADAFNCDGIGIFDRCGSRVAIYRDGGVVHGDMVVRFPYWSGGVFWQNGIFFGED